MINRLQIFRLFDIGTGGKFIKKMFIPSMINQYGDVRHTFEDGETWLLKGTNSFELILCSGLKDKHGKDIYRGDIFMFGDIQNVLLFKNGMFCYETSCKNDFVPLANRWFEWKNDQSNEIEVIGNIFENEKLILQQHDRD